MGLFTFLNRRGSGDGGELTIEEMLALVRSNDGQAALAAAERKVESASRRAGPNSGAHAAALFELAQVCLALNLVPRAAGALERATALPGQTPDDEKDRLTYLMNLGDVLAANGKFEAALAAHARSLEGRAAFYGKDHPGYGFGLDSWADVALALGRFDEARAALDEALQIYVASGHPRQTRALGFRLLAAQGQGQGAPPSLRLKREQAAEVLTAIVQRTSPVASAVEARALAQLEPLVADDQQMLQAWAQLQHRARTQHDYATWAESLERIGAIAARLGDPGLALNVELGLGLCADEAGDVAGATRAYEAALVRSRELGSAARVGVLRNAGLFFNKGETKARGLALLREAVAADAGGDEGARSLVALGIALQHAGEREAAATHLRRALAVLDAAHPDAICAKSHLGAIESSGSCGCGQTDQEIQAQVERLVRERLPAGLLDRVVIGADGVQIHVARTLTDAEARMVADAAELAHAELRRRIRATYA